MIFCFPRPVTSNRVLFLLPLIIRFSSTNDVILPCLFSVPSMFQAMMGFSSGWVLSPVASTYFWSMNFPLAPLSMSARVSTVSFSLAFSIMIGMDNEFDSMVATVTEKMSIMGDVDVDAALHFKNPPSQLLGKIVLFLLHSSSL